MILGITGGIGSGKSHVCRLLEKEGAKIFTCDTVAKQIMVEDHKVIEAITDEFGDDSYTFCMGYLSLETKYLANIVFSDKEKLKKLEVIIHPRVIEEFGKFITKKSAIYKLLKKEHVFVMETAMLFDHGWDKYVDKTVWVDAPLEQRISRVMKRDNVTKEQVLKRMNFQADHKDKADAIIFNDDTKDDIEVVDITGNYFK